MTALSARKYFEPHSEERPDLAEQFLEQQEKIRQKQKKKDLRQFLILIVCMALATIALPLVTLAIQTAVEAKACERNPIVCQM